MKLQQLANKPILIWHALFFSPAFQSRAAKIFHKLTQLSLLTGKFHDFKIHA